jgi:hypothetical protein
MLMKLSKAKEPIRDIKLLSRVYEALEDFTLVKEIDSWPKYVKVCRMHSSLDL